MAKAPSNAAAENAAIKANAEKQKALSLVLGQIERNFGKGSIMRLGDATRMKVETVSSGALTLDLAKPAELFPEIYQDWGDDEKFSLKLGRGECAA